MQNPRSFIPQETADGSFTFFSPEFEETFHSHQGAKLEAELKFVRPLQLRQKAQQPVLRILDICYGLGYNTAAALQTIWEVNPNCRVEWVGLELDAQVPKAAIAHHLLDAWSPPIPQLLTTLATHHQLQVNCFEAQLCLGDARQTIEQVIARNFQADAIFLDPFSPPHCPQLWTVEFIGRVANCLKRDGLLATYSCSAAVRTAFLKAGLKIASTSPVGRRSPGTVASFLPVELPELSQKEQEHLQTKAAIPYRDRFLTDTPENIIKRRQAEQLASSLEPTSHWKKRWLERS